MALALSTFTCVLGKGCLLAGGIGALSSCAPVRYIPLPERHRCDSTHVTSDHRYDSIYIDRWHSLIQRGDTIYKTDSIYVEKVHDVEVHDTVTVVRRDSVPYPVEVIREVPSPIPRVYKNCTLGFWILLLGIILSIALRLYFRR